MVPLYLAGLILLVIVGFLFGRSRAAAAERSEPLHSRPSYHGAYVAVCVLIPMFVLLAVGLPIANRFVVSQTLQAYDPAIMNDDLKRGAVLRDIVAACPRALFRRADAGVAPRGRRLRLDLFLDLQSDPGDRLVFGLLGTAYGLRSLSAGFRARNQVERVVKWVLLAPRRWRC